MTNSPAEQSAKLGIPRLTLRLWRHLHPGRRKQFVLVSLLMGVSAFAEVLTLGAVIPFITVLVDPERVFLYGPVAYLAKLLGVTRPEELVLPLAMVFVAGALLAAAIRLAVVWSASRLAVAIGADLSAEAYERTLYQPYSIHVGRSTSEITSGVIHKVEAVVNGMFAPLQVAIGSVLTMVTVTGALLLIDPVIAMIAMVGFGGGYVATTSVLSDRLKDNSRRIAQEQTRVVKAIQEGVGGIRDVLIDGTQTVFLDQFRNSDRPMRQAHGSNTVIQQAPRVVMEGVAMLLVAMLAVVLSGRSGGIAGGLPILGALALDDLAVLLEDLVLALEDVRFRELGTEGDALIFEKGSAQDLADKLEALLERSPAERRALGSRLRAIAARDHDPVAGALQGWQDFAVLNRNLIGIVAHQVDVILILQSGLR